MSADPRLGTRDSNGVITEYPTQYADGTTFSRTADPAPTMILFSDTVFSFAKSGQGVLSTTLYDELEALAGSSVAISSYTGLLADLDIEDITTETTFDDFKGASLDSVSWNDNVNGTSASATVPGTSGYSLLELVTGTDDNGFATIVHDTLTCIANATQTLIETRVRLSAITNLIFEFGFSDAKSEAGGTAFSSHDATPVAVATDAVVFGFQHDTGAEENTVISGLAVRNGTAQRSATTATFSANTFVELAVALAKNSSQVDAAFFVNGVRLTTISNAVTSTVALIPWITVKALAASGSRTVGVDYIRITSSR